MSRPPRPAASRPRAVWLHAAEPGQQAPLAILADAIADLPDAPDTVLTGEGTPDPADARAIEDFLERDAIGAVVIAGDALPATVIDCARQQGMGLFLVNARDPHLSGRWRLFPNRLRTALGAFAQIHAVSPEAARHLRASLKGGTLVHPTGALARHPPAPPCDLDALDAMRAMLGARPVWLAYGLPPAEADAVLLAHADALRRAHRLVLIALPQEPAQAEMLAARARDVGFVCALRSVEDEIDETTQVYIVDTGEDPGLFLRLAPVSFLGGTLSAGAPSPSALTAASLGSALIFGPEAGGDQRDFLGRLAQTGAARRIGQAPALGEALTELLSPEAGAQAALRAWTLVSEGGEATAAVAREIALWMQLNGDRP